jgi:hypothetical protein
MTQLSPQQVLAVEDLPFGKLILTQTYAIKLVKLYFMVRLKGSVEEAPLPKTLKADTVCRPPRPTQAGEQHGSMVYVDDLEVGAAAAPSQQLVTLQEPPAHDAAVTETPNTLKKFRVLSKILNRMPFPADFVCASSTAQVVGGDYIEMPWSFMTVQPVHQHASFQDDLAATRLGAAVGISPRFHGSCIVNHSADGALYCNLNYVTGLLTSCTWMRQLITNELAKLHHTSPHINSPFGVLVTSRPENRLGKLDKQAAKGLSKHARLLESQLSALHWRAVEHGLLLLDLHPNTIGVTGTQLTLLDWSRVIIFSLSKLAMQPGGNILCRFIKEVPQGVITNTLERILHTHKGAW